MMDKESVERALAAYERYINSGVIIDRREMVRLIVEAAKGEKS